MKRLSFSSKTVVRTYFPSSRHDMPEYRLTFKINRSTPSARITKKSTWAPKPKMTEVRNLPRRAPLPSCRLTFSFNVPVPRSFHPPSVCMTYSFARVWYKVASSSSPVATTPSANSHWSNHNSIPSCSVMATLCSSSSPFSGAPLDRIWPKLD